MSKTYESMSKVTPLRPKERKVWVVQKRNGIGYIEVYNGFLIHTPYFSLFWSDGVKMT